MKCLSYIEGASICYKIQSLPNDAYLTFGLAMQPVSRPLRCSSHQDRHSSMKPIFGPANTTKCCKRTTEALYLVAVKEQRGQCRVFGFLSSSLLSPPPPPRHYCSVWVLPVISLIFTRVKAWNTRVTGHAFLA